MRQHQHQRPQLQRVLICLTLLLASSTTIRAQVLTVTYPRPESEEDFRSNYFTVLLDLVLSKTEGPYELKQSTSFMQQGRALAQLERGGDVDLVWSMTSADREDTLQPIRIPLFRGLIGTRLLLVRESDLDRFAAITSVEELKAMRTGQGHDWPDLSILKHNGFEVMGSASYGAIFKMLEKERIEFFPRSLEEIWEEANFHSDEGLVIEPTLVLYYPSAIYYFVNKNNSVLAERLETGVRAAIADGSFEAHFNTWFETIIERARLHERKVFRLENPLLTPHTPLEDTELWYPVKAQ